MKLKLVKEYQYNGEMIPVDSIIEIEDEAVANALIQDGTAIEYTDEVVEQEEVTSIIEEAKNLKSEIQKKSLQIEGNKIMNEKMFGKSIKNAIESKTVESYSSTDATQPLGIVSLANGFVAKARKQPMNGSTLNIVYSATQTTTADLPVIEIIGEATAGATTVPLTQYSAIASKFFATVAIPAEYLDDVTGMEAFVSDELTNKADLVIENSVLNGAFGSNKGLKGVLQSADSIDNGSVTLSAITAQNLHDMVDSLLPECQRNAIWVVNPATWSQLKTSFMDADNVNNQLITDGLNKSLLGYPVQLSVCMPTATPIMIGDFSKYIIGVAREMGIEVDRSSGFLTDVVPVKVSMRFAGGPAMSKKLYNSKYFGAFVYASA